MSITVAIILVLIAFLGGIGTTTIGPGGIFVTIAVYLLLNTSPGTTAGTMSVTFIGTGLVGSIAYFRSGQLRDRSTQGSALILGATSVAGVWTAKMFLIFSLARPDVFAVEDLGIRRGMTVLYGLEDRSEMTELAERWSPARSLACLYLWRASEG